MEGRSNIAELISTWPLQILILSVCLMFHQSMESIICCIQSGLTQCSPPFHLFVDYSLYAIDPSGWANSKINIMCIRPSAFTIGVC